MWMRHKSLLTFDFWDPVQIATNYKNLTYSHFANYITNNLLEIWQYFMDN